MSAHAVDPDVRHALGIAMQARAPVVVTLRGTRRRVEGVPIGFVDAIDERPRVVIEVARESTEQIVLLERIESVQPL